MAKVHESQDWLYRIANPLVGKIVNICCMYLTVHSAVCQAFLFIVNERVKHNCCAVILKNSGVHTQLQL